MRRVIILVIMVAALLTIGNGKEQVMGMGWEQYGRAAGYDQAGWDALPQSQKNSIKAWIDGVNGGGGATTSGLSRGTTSDGYRGLALLDPAPVSEPTMDYTGTDGSGSGSYAAAAPVRVLNESPEWLAYLNALNMEEQQFRADVDKTRALYQSDAERQKQDLIPVYGQSRRGVAGSMESRGMARSGELLRRLAENRAQEGRQRAGIESTLAGQTSGLESQLAQKLVGLNTQRTEREMQLRSQGYV